MKTIGLCMIVKNESRVIERCLDSVRSLVDYVLVDDTGSTDGTQQIIRDWLDRHGIAGQVTEEPWQDFAHNRSVALARLRQHPEVDYALIMDADDVLVLEAGFDPAVFKEGLHADLYHVGIQLGPVRYHRPHLCNNRLEYRYRGVVHEFLEGPDGASSADATGLTINAGVEGARSQDPDKYRKDAEALAHALETEQDSLLRSRYTFYLGQSWRDCGEHEKALAAYLERAGMGFWDEEVFISLYNAAQLKEKLNHPGYEVIGMHMRAYEACPRRAESLHAAARFCRATGKNHQGYMLAKQGLDIPQPSGGLFVEPWIYEYGLLDELAVNGYWAGKYQDCTEACERLLRESKMPEGMRERVEMNANFAREKLGIAAPVPALVKAEPEQAGERRVVNILRPGAIGDVLVTSAVTAQLSARDPELVIHYYTKYRQMAELLVGVTKVFDADQWGQREPGTDYNLIGYPFDEGYPQRPMQKHLAAYFCGEAGLPWALPQLREPEPYEFDCTRWITVHSAAAWSVYKQWDTRGWNEVIARLHLEYPDIAIVQLGVSDDEALEGVDHDLRGRTSLPQALWLVRNSLLHLGVDSFTNHAAGAFRHPAVILFGSTNPTAFGYDTAVNLWAGLGCSPCYREDPRYTRHERGPCLNPPGQAYEDRRHACMAAIGVEQVWTAIVGSLARDLRATAQRSRDPADADMPRVLLAILAKQKERVLPLYLMCIEALEYPKDRIVLYVRTNNNTDRTADVLAEWLARVADQYEAIEFDDSNVPEPVETLDVYEWDETRLRVLAAIRQQSMTRALARGVDYYFVADVDNFLKPNTLRNLVELGLPIVAPLIRHSDHTSLYSNFHHKIDASGYFAPSDQYDAILGQAISGIIEVPVVHSTYLVRRDVIPKLTYLDATSRHEYVVFSESARHSAICQFLDNRQVYGYLTFAQEAADCWRLLGPSLGPHILKTENYRKRLVFCCGLQSSGSTWLYNVVREICLQSGQKFASMYSDTANLPYDRLLDGFLIVKSHNPDASIINLMREYDISGVVTVRDPRDSVVSVMQRFGYSFEDAATFVEASSIFLSSLSAEISLQVFKYENGFVESTETICAITALLGLQLSAEEIASIMATLGPDGVKAKIGELLDAGAIQEGQLVWDLDTAWHANHVGDRKIGKYAEMLNDDQQATVMERTISFRSRFGYIRPECNDCFGITDVMLLNLDRSRDRLKCFESRNSHVNYMRISACDGALVDAATLVAQGIISHDLTYRPGAIGCAMSHISLWRKVLKTGRAATICEDDAVFSQCFPSAAEILVASLECEWDIITWGYNFSHFIWVEILPGITPMEMRPNFSLFGENLDQFQSLQVRPTLIKLLHQFGTVCYSVSPRGAEALLDECVPLAPRLIAFKDFPITIENDGIDCIMNAVYPNMNAYTCVPPLVVPDQRVASTIR
jgi:ADP-heptose:LPS heptosyltransferase/GR25 family glycosyltransferase involved in LPS biosynthesis/glycosyltransferase involved in cell wall biosynthesis